MFIGMLILAFAVLIPNGQLQLLLLTLFVCLTAAQLKVSLMDRVKLSTFHGTRAALRSFCKLITNLLLAVNGEIVNCFEKVAELVFINGLLSN